MTLTEEKINEYLNYIDEHRANVKTAWQMMKDNCMDIIKENILPDLFASTMELVDHNIEKHDLSKYSVYEFDAYRRHWHPVNEEEKKASELDFEKAWKYHYGANMHHYQYWSSTNQQEVMPYIYVLEMLADWTAMSLYFKSSLDGWYKAEKDMDLGVKQKKQTEELIERIELLLKKKFHGFKNLDKD